MYRTSGGRVGRQFHISNHDASGIRTAQVRPPYLAPILSLPDPYLAPILSLPDPYLAPILSLPDPYLTPWVRPPRCARTSPHLAPAYPCIKPC